ncbi:RNA polymerase sigma-70 factor, ECF subfamily [Tistlia consotensis]|nr:RNA polymerase sigma factor [Tistlia consotensis]SNR42699.1 RNA polymerase sigma-70 factor, ECF subfamily [Tistlia consotensis]
MRALLLQAYRAHERDLIRFLARRLSCMTTARDLAHDLYVKLHDLEPPAELRHEKAYLFRMAANLAADHQRSTARRGALLAEVQSFLADSPERRTPEQIVAARQEVEAMRRVVEGLPELSRRIFRLNRFEGRSQREIAALLGVSQTTVENHMRKVLSRLTEARTAADSGGDGA